ncbi:MAG TPA: hypothetical protein VMA72_21495 [Streptosporangiaceae bacterium]|nr:hypothetical protein [Streptosporangiaceae bacterium]
MRIRRNLTRSYTACWTPMAGQHHPHATAMATDVAQGKKSSDAEG